MTPQARSATGRVASRHSKDTKTKSALPLALAGVILFAQAAVGADQISEVRSKIQSLEARIAALQTSLSSLFAEMDSLEQALVHTYGRLGSSQIRLADLEMRVAQARSALANRARRAYMSGGGRQIAVLLKAQTFAQFLTFSRNLGGSLSADASVYRELVAARDALKEEQGAVDIQKQNLLQGARRLAAVKTEIKDALISEQAVLKSAQTELDKLLAQRKRTVSPAVEARRSIRQVELDKKLAALLAWYAPGIGPEPFMPPNLRSTGIVTSGLSSWYGPGFDGRRASSGATYRMNQLTAASLVLPFGTFLKVTFRGKAVVVVITDRGPYIAGRVLDLSWAAADALGLSGVKEIRMEILVPASPAPPFP